MENTQLNDFLSDQVGYDSYDYMWTHISNISRPFGIKYIRDRPDLMSHPYHLMSVGNTIAIRVELYLFIESRVTEIKERIKVLEVSDEVETLFQPIISVFMDGTKLLGDTCKTKYHDVLGYLIMTEYNTKDKFSELLQLPAAEIVSKIEETWSKGTVSGHMTLLRPDIDFCTDRKSGA